MKGYWTVGLFTLLLTACVTVKDSQALFDKNFLKSSDYLTLKTNALHMFSDRFNKNLFEYSVSRADVGFTEIQTNNLVDVKHTDVKVNSNLVDWLFFDSPYPYPYGYSVEEKTYESRGETKFSFYIGGAQTSPSKVKCRHFYRERKYVSENDLNKNTKDKSTAGNISQNNSNSTSTAPGERVSTYLSCEANINGGAWKYGVEIPAGKAIVDYYPDDHNAWKLKGTQDFTQQLSDGSTSDSRTLPSWVRPRMSGFELFFDNKQLGALSIVGKPKIYLSKTASGEERLKAAVYLYSIFILSDIDLNWNMTSNL